MITAEVQETSIELSLQPVLEALEKSPALFMDKVKDLLIHELQLKLSGHIPSPDMLAMYPFFGDIPKLLSNYKAAIEVTLDKGDAALSVNKDNLRASGLPVELPFLLEYGNSTIPPFPHIRATMLALPSIVAQVTREVSKS